MCILTVTSLYSYTTNISFTQSLVLRYLSIKQPSNSSITYTHKKIIWPPKYRQPKSQSDGSNFQVPAWAKRKITSPKQKEPGTRAWEYLPFECLLLFQSSYLLLFRPSNKPLCSILISPLAGVERLLSP